MSMVHAGCDSGVSSSFHMYVVAHKEFDRPAIDGYQPIGVGPLSMSRPRGFLSDGIGVNISEKNPEFCELTALYWIWMNDSTSEIVGLSHYRRYFARRFDPLGVRGYVDESEVRSMLERSDMILPVALSWADANVARQYTRAGIGHLRDLRVTRDVIAEYYPEYLPDFDEVMAQHSLHCYNMFATKKSVSDKYCAWLFSILFEVEARVDITGYSVQERRVFGYLAERLLNVWVLHNGLKIVELPVVNTERGCVGTLRDEARRLRARWQLSHRSVR